MTQPRRRARLLKLTALLAALAIAWCVGDRALRAAERPVSFGSGGCGKLDGGAVLACEGPNFRAGAGEACALGRNYLFPDVRDVVVDGYALVAAATPTRTWQVGETGRAHGGRLWPHRTHQNGLAADFFVPVLGAGGAPELLYISPLNKFGYGLEFDAQGKLGAQHIDWRALGQHLLALEAAGLKRDVHLERVILTPAFHAPLFEAVPELRRLEPLFMKQEAWVRHDEHYHVDFSIPAAFRKPLSCT